MDVGLTLSSILNEAYPPSRLALSNFRDVTTIPLSPSFAGALALGRDSGETFITVMTRYGHKGSVESVLQNLSQGAIPNGMGFSLALSLVQLRQEYLLSRSCGVVLYSKAKQHLVLEGTLWVLAIGPLQEEAARGAVILKQQPAESLQFWHTTGTHCNQLSPLLWASVSTSVK